MGTSNGKESCGRCSFTTVVDAVEAAGIDVDRADPSPPFGPPARHDPYAGGHIEIDERELRLANAPAVLAGRLKHRIDRAAAGFIYGR